MFTLLCMWMAGVFDPPRYHVPTQPIEPPEPVEPGCWTVTTRTSVIRDGSGKIIEERRGLPTVSGDIDAYLKSKNS